jgi:hypothetical protein
MSSQRISKRKATPVDSGILAIVQLDLSDFGMTAELRMVQRMRKKTNGSGYIGNAIRRYALRNPRLPHCGNGSRISRDVDSEKQRTDSEPRRVTQEIKKLIDRPNERRWFAAAKALKEITEEYSAT